MTAPAAERSVAGIELVETRPLVLPGLVAWFELAPGDRALVAAGDAIAAGAPLAERLRDPRLAEAAAHRDDARRPGERIAGASGHRPSLRRAQHPAGELLYAAGGRWRLATGELIDPLEAPASGIVREVVPGSGIAVGFGGHALAGVLGLGGPARGRLALATDASGEVRPAAIDVGRSGTILVVGARVDAETLTRARAMGVRGIVTASLGAKDLRDFSASETRQRAALHRLPPLAVLVLEGAVRRPISGPAMAVLAALAGAEVAIVSDPPALLFEASEAAAIVPPPGWVRVRGGPWVGREGRFEGLVGPRRFAAGTHLEAGLVRFEDGAAPTVLPLADLERFV
jgi:hypothetical protein